jgi:hypothetical protein
MVRAYITTDVEVDFSDFDTDDLIEELENRGIDLNTKGVDGDAMRELLENIFQARRTGKPYDQMLDEMIWYGLGRIV